MRSFVVPFNGVETEVGRRYCPAGSTVILTIRSGAVTWPLSPSPFLMSLTYCMPLMTWPTMVYWPSSEGCGAKQMKNWLFAVFGSLGARHADRPGHEFSVVREFRGRFGQTTATGARAGRVAALGHEAVDDAVEGRAVIEALLRQRDEAGDGLGRQIGGGAG